MRSGYCIFCNYHFWIQFAFAEYIFYVSGNNRFVSFKQKHQLILCEPYGLILEFDINVSLPVGGLIENNFSFGLSILCFWI